MTVTPGSKQILDTIADAGAYQALIAAGARMLEPACGPCVGMGQAPPTGSVSVRTFNRNFPGRSGTDDDQVYLCSPTTAAATVTNILAILIIPMSFMANVIRVMTLVLVTYHFGDEAGQGIVHGAAGMLLFIVALFLMLLLDSLLGLFFKRDRHAPKASEPKKEVAA